MRLPEDVVAIIRHMTAPHIVFDVWNKGFVKGFKFGTCRRCGSVVRRARLGDEIASGYYIVRYFTEIVPYKYRILHMSNENAVECVDC